MQLIVMFSRGTHLAGRTFAPGAQRLLRALKDSPLPSPVPACSCHGNGRHGDRALPLTARRQSRVVLPRATVCSEGAFYRSRLFSSVACDEIASSATACARRHLSTDASGSDATERKTPSSSDPTREDAFEEMVKELDAEGTDRRKARKGKSSSDGLKDLKDSMRSVGRLVPDKVVNLLDEDGTLLGALHRAAAIRRSEETGLKLVLTNPDTRPYPTYRLMTGQQLHQEQMHLRERLKTKSAPTLVKETRVTGNIAPHDLQVKQRHVQDWFKDGAANVHVRVTVLGARKRQKPVTKEQQMEVVRQLMAGLEDRVTFMNKPRDGGKDGANLMVTLRPMSAKEKAAAIKQRNREGSLQPTADGPERGGAGESEGTPERSGGGDGQEQQ